MIKSWLLKLRVVVTSRDFVIGFVVNILFVVVTSVFTFLLSLLTSALFVLIVACIVLISIVAFHLLKKRKMSDKAILSCFVVGAVAFLAFMVFATDHGPSEWWSGDELARKDLTLEAVTYDGELVGMKEIFAQISVNHGRLWWCNLDVLYEIEQTFPKTEKGNVKSGSHTSVFFSSVLRSSNKVELFDDYAFKKGCEYKVSIRIKVSNRTNGEFQDFKKIHGGLTATLTRGDE